MKQLTVADAKAIAKRLGCDGVIVIAIENVQGFIASGQVYVRAEGRIQAASYGATKTKCTWLGKALDRLHRQVCDQGFWKGLR